MNSVLSGYSNTEKWVEKRGAAEFFFNQLRGFGYLMKHSFECLVELLKLSLNKIYAG